MCDPFIALWPTTKVISDGIYPQHNAKHKPLLTPATPEADYDLTKSTVQPKRG